MNEKPAKKTKVPELWRRYELTMNFTGRLCASVPQSKELVRPWLESRMPSKKPEDGKSIAELEAEMLEKIEQIEERTLLGFERIDNGDKKGLVVRGGTIKAHIKDCADQIKYALKIDALRSKVANKVYIAEYHVPILKSGALVSEHDDVFEQPVHVMTAQGPRNALKVIRFVRTPTLRCTLMLLNEASKELKSGKTRGGEVNIDVIRAVLEYGTIHGYGGERGMGEGRYTFELREM